MVQNGSRWSQLSSLLLLEKFLTNKVLLSGHLVSWLSGYLVIIPFTSDGWVVSRPHYYSADPSEPCVKMINRIIFDEKEIIEMMMVVITVGQAGAQLGDLCHCYLDFCGKESISGAGIALPKLA